MKLNCRVGKEVNERKCQYCGKMFYDGKTTKKYCCHSCRQFAYRDRLAEKKQELKPIAQDMLADIIREREDLLESKDMTPLAEYVANQIMDRPEVRHMIYKFTR